jgi:hypothetical protein
VRNIICQKHRIHIKINILDIVWEIASSSDVKNVWSRISTPLTPSWRGRGSRLLLVLLVTLYIIITVFVILRPSLFILFPLNMLEAVHTKVKE